MDTLSRSRAAARHVTALQPKLSVEKPMRILALSALTVAVLAYTGMYLLAVSPLMIRAVAGLIS